MREPTEIEKQQDARLAEIVTLGRQRYLNTGGDPRHSPSGRCDNDYLTDEERQEAIMLMRKLAGITIKKGYIHCQGRSWELPNHLAKLHG